MDLRATWNATSLVHEAAEWLGDSANDPTGKFYAFAELMTTTAGAEVRTDTCWTRLKEAMDHLVDGQLRQVGRVALASRQYSPRLETFRQLSVASDPGEETCCWVVVDGKTVITDPGKVADWVENGRDGSDRRDRVLDIDHRWGGDGHGDAQQGGSVIALYGPMDSACSAVMHKAIVDAIGKGTSGTKRNYPGIAYVWRPIPYRAGACKGGDGITHSSCSTLGAGGPLTIPGYGVELALKSTEYNAQDDATQRNREKDDSAGKTILSNPEKLDIRLGNFSDIGKHVLEKVAAAEDGLRTLKAITEDFPSIVDEIADVTVSKGTAEAVESLANSVMPDAKLLVINGAAMNPQDLSWHGILEKVRTESEFMQALHDLGINIETVSALVTRRVVKSADAGDVRLDYRATISADEVLWLSDVETDPMFAGVPTELHSMLEMDFMGQRSPVRRNLFTGVMLVDVSTRAGASAIATASGLLRQGFPVKIGIVPCAGVDEGTGINGIGGVRDWDLATAFVATALGTSPRLAADLFAAAAARVPQSAWSSEATYATAMRKTLVADPRVIFVGEAEDSAGGEQQLADAFLKRAVAAVEQLGVDLGRDLEDDGDDADDSNLTNGALLMNGAVHTATSPSMWRSMIVTAWQSEGETLARLVRDSTLVDASTDLLGDILKALGAVPRMNSRIIKKRTDLSGVDTMVEDPTVDLHIGNVRAVLQAIGDSDIEYIHKDVSGTFPVTHWIIVHSKDDPLVEEGRKAVAAGTLASSRVGVVALDSPLAAVLMGGVRMGHPGVVTNGRFLRNRFAGDVTSGDFILMERVAQKEMFADESLLETLSHVKSNASPSTSTSRSDLAAVLSSVMTQYSGGAQVQPEAISLMDRSPSVTKLVAPSKFASTFSTAPLQIRALFAPLSPAGQQLAPILAFLHDWFHADIEVVLNVEPSYSDMPLKSYYRFVTPDEPGPDDLGGGNGYGDGVAEHGASITDNNHALFPGLPLQDILTLGMDVPEAWLVSAVRSKHDLDNIQLSNIEEADLEATYQLDHVLVTGMALDAQRMTHPRGVQLELVRGDTVTDTLVMSNLGYFQLKADPGLWELRLAPGASREIYHVKGIEDFGIGNHHPTYEDGIVPVTSFIGRHMLLLLERNEGAGGRDVLDGSLANESDEGDREDERIHVFTVASGHMYERLQSIMIAGAVKRSSRRIKFWFLSDVISPDYRDILDVYAEQYGFDYELVTYRWPMWLRKQTEKQRKIWAYKILFLDTLFPTKLKRVIFIDSDSTVRGDLAEAWEMDLKGAPYAYTPMCNGEDGDEMDGYRFWKRGFWEEHLQGKPYHISAFYIVDLQRFRALAAGDRLRIAYEQLSRDPNSLANLDQDLPNFASTMPNGIPIHSLGPEWLWCDSWCGSDSRSQAKVIDLCNNPLTREPKLESARRLVSEWSSLNDEVGEFTRRARGWLNGSVSREDLEDQSYKVKASELVRAGTGGADARDGRDERDQGSHGSGHGDADDANNANNTDNANNRDHQSDQSDRHEEL